MFVWPIKSMILFFCLSVLAISKASRKNKYLTACVWSDLETVFTTASTASFFSLPSLLLRAISSNGYITSKDFQVANASNAARFCSEEALL